MHQTQQILLFLTSFPHKKLIIVNLLQKNKHFEDFIESGICLKRRKLNLTKLKFTSKGKFRLNLCY